MRTLPGKLANRCAKRERDTRARRMRRVFWVLEAIHVHRSVRLRQIQKWLDEERACSVCGRTVRRDVQILVEVGIVLRIECNRGSQYELNPCGWQIVNFGKEVAV